MLLLPPGFVDVNVNEIGVSLETDCVTFDSEEERKEEVGGNRNTSDSCKYEERENSVETTDFVVHNTRNTPY